MKARGDLLQRIRHFVVVMLENRSFDHMLGFLYRDTNNVSPLGHPFDGLTGRESNPDGRGRAVRVFPVDRSTPYAYFTPMADPGEGFLATSSQLFGTTHPAPGAAPDNQGFVTDFAYTLGWEGREHRSIVPGARPRDIMGIYTPEMLPVLSALARGYAVSDQWFSPAPTETMPNRAFSLLATSEGRLTDKDKVFTAKSIFRLLDAAGVSWAVHGYDSLPLTRTSIADITDASDDQFGEFRDFQRAVRTGNLPSFVFLEPHFGAGGNSQHPDHDVSRGEQFLYELYTTLQGSAVWDETLLVITYDEHGGCYDHVAPPSNAVPPDDSAGDFGFDFRRFGVRVPAVLVSPLIQAGTVLRAPSGPRGRLATPFDHTSILATVEKRFGLPSLTARDAAAPTLEGALTLRVPRSDDPLRGVTPPVSSERVHDHRPSHLEQVLAESVANLPAEDPVEGYHHTMPELRTSDELHEYVKRRFRQHRAWMESGGRSRRRER